MAHGGGSEKVPAITINAWLGSAYQAQVRLVNQVGGLKGLSGLFLGQLLGSQPAEIVIDE